jgi:superfamily I DNA/RNA helicase
VALLESRHAVGISSLANFKNVFRQKGGIKISSIHGIKGTEFDVVIGFGLLNSWVPHFKDNNGTVNSKKMMYVLGSRARKNLHLFSETGRQVNQRNPRGLLPTPCLIGYHYAYTAVPS